MSRRPRIGRPPSPVSELQRHSVHVTLTDREFRALKRIAAAERKAMAFWAREAVLRELRRRTGSRASRS